MQVCREVGAGAVLTDYFPRPRTKHRARTFFFRSQERNTELGPFFSEAKNETPTWNYFFPGFLNWKCYFFFVSLRRRCRANALHHRSVEWCLPTPRNPEGELSSQWLILPSRLHVVLPAGSCPPCRPFMTAPPNHHPADDAERISSICGCLHDRTPSSPRAHSSSTYGPLRARRAGGRRLSRMRHWKGQPCQPPQEEEKKA